MAEKKDVIVETTEGKIKGYQEDGIHYFKGIPFAAPPVGDLRWLPPQPVEPWTGVRPADSFGPISYQKKDIAAALAALQATLRARRHAVFSSISATYPHRCTAPRE